MFDTFEKGILKFKKVIKYQQLRQLITLRVSETTF